MTKFGLNGFLEWTKGASLRYKLREFWWQLRYAWQRAWRGYDFTDVFELGYNFTAKMPVLLTEFLKNNVGLFYDAALEHKDRLIVHATITGYGHSALEPNVPTPYEEFAAIMELVKAGFPMEKIVIRIDPIIPTEKGLLVAYRTMISFMEMGFQRYRVSVIDMYPHARSRFKKAGLPLPYGDNGFAPSQAQLSKVDDMLRQAKQFWEGMDNGKVLRIESCAEPGLTEPIACGCISDYDLNLLGFSEDAESNGAGYQRKGCMCYAGKTELLKHKTRCPHGCLYCYWKDIKG